MERLTFDGKFCDIAQCRETPGGSFCENGTCSQKEVWLRLKAYEDTVLMQELLVPPNAYVIPIGNWENANAAVAQILVQRIRRHPLLWKLFFMI